MKKIIASILLLTTLFGSAACHGGPKTNPDGETTRPSSPASKPTVTDKADKPETTAPSTPDASHATDETDRTDITETTDTTESTDTTDTTDTEEATDTSVTTDSEETTGTEGSTDSSAAPSGDTFETLTDGIEALYKIQPVDFEYITHEADINDPDVLKYATGLSRPDGITGAAYSESPIMPSTFSLVLVRAESPAAARQAAESMRDGIDPNKWICTESDDVKVAVKDDLIMLIMTTSDDDISSDDWVDAFTELCGEPDMVLKK